MSSVIRTKVSSNYKDKNVLNYMNKNVLNYKDKIVLNYKDKNVLNCEDKNVLKVARTKYTQIYKDNNVLKINVLKLQEQQCPQIMRTKMSALIRSHDHCLILANKNRGFHRGYNLCI
ncbi:hypothetical protein RhiirA5_434725 [Rhizophagus irregularis]|uniref:Uncharacterized protein n=1 Tax=Rhizophagus irregularis TaxID=588596 RepID=A0A2N0NPJ7_9GLOM|nr:hypothetical protein RhiirA5_434725 [Rhizophagus irregularis]